MSDPFVALLVPASAVKLALYALRTARGAIADQVLPKNSTEGERALVLHEIDNATASIATSLQHYNDAIGATSDDTKA